MANITYHDNGTITVSITLDLQGSLIEMENTILDATHEIGCLATGAALKRFDSNGLPILEELQNLPTLALSETVKAGLDATITYFKNNSAEQRMNFAYHRENNLPIGSGVTEAACKTLVKQRLCGSGMRWKSRGAKVVLSLRALVQTTNRWQQFWDKINQFGADTRFV